jgi:hypothetical protein
LKIWFYRKQEVSVETTFAQQHEWRSVGIIDKESRCSKAIVDRGSIGRLNFVPFFCIEYCRSAAQERRGEKVTIGPGQFRDPYNEYSLFAGTGTTY